MPTAEVTARNIPPARLYDLDWRINLGENLRICLQIMETTVPKFATETELDVLVLDGIIKATHVPNHEIIETIRLKIGLPISDIIMVYGTDYLRHLKLSNKLTALKEPPKPRRSKVPVLTKDGRYNLSDPEIRKNVAKNIRRLAQLKFPTFTMKLFLGGVGKNEVWLSNLEDNRASLTEDVLQRFATKLGVDKEMIFTGEGIDKLENPIQKRKT